MRIEPTPEDIAWAAGLFEGEGCFNAYRRKSGKWGIQVRLSMTDADVVERFAKVVGVGSIRSHHSAVHRERGDKRLYEWYVQSAQGAIKVIDLLSPRLGERRAAKASEVRAIASTLKPHNGLRTHCPQGHPYEGDNLAFESGKRRCVTCRNTQSRERARKRLGITPDRFRVKED